MPLDDENSADDDDHLGTWVIVSVTADVANLLDVEEVKVICLRNFIRGLIVGTFCCSAGSSSEISSSCDF